MRAAALLAGLLVVATGGPALAQGPGGVPAVPPGYSYAPPPPPAPIDPERPAIATPAPSPHAPPRRSDTRATGEMVDLYVTVSGFGAFTGIYVPLVTGLGPAAGSDELDVYYAAGFGTGAVFALLPLALDLGDDFMPSGVPSSISTGLRIGLAAGAGGVGVGIGELSGNDVVHVLWGTALAGGVLGAALGYGLRPHPAQVQFIQVSAIWGAALGVFAALALAPLAAPSEVANVGFGIGLGGMLGGVSLATILAAVELSPSAGRAWMCTLGLLAGAGAGTGLFAIGALVMNRWDVQGWGVAGGLGAAAGLAIALGVSRDGDAPTHFGPDVDVRPSLSPTEGGALVGLDGSF